MTRKQDGSVKVSFDHDTNQTRKVGMFLQSSNFDRNDKINPFTQMASNPCGSKPPSKGR